jgi:type VI secretion system protein ImpA
MVGSPQSIDIESLLAPVSETAPTGSNVRDDASPSSPYFRLKDLRKAARVAERNADSRGEDAGHVPEWKTARDLAAAIIAGRSKDLEVTAWLIEALVRTDGFAGLRDGFRLARNLIERYWDTLYSLEDDEGIATKVAPLTGLNGVDGDGTLIQPIKKVPVTKPGANGTYAAYHYEQALSLSQIKDDDVRARRMESGMVTVEQFKSAVNESGGPFYVDLLADIGDSLSELEAFTTVLNERAGHAAPPVSAIRNVLTATLESVGHFSKDLVEQERLAAERKEASTTDQKRAGNGLEPGHGQFAAFEGQFRSREEALRLLDEVAEFFGRYEPHSPIGSSLKETVRRARMPFSELLRELVPDTAAWRGALSSAGIKPPPEN